MQVASRRGDSRSGGGAARSSLDPLATASLTETAAVRIEPVTSTVRPGDTFTVSVMITDVVNLGAFQFAMAYTPTVVHVERARLGPFLGSSGRNASPLGPTIDNEAGLMVLGAFSFGMQPGPDGGGTLARIALTAQGPGQTPLDLQNTEILSPSAEHKPVKVADGAAVVEGKLYLPLVLRQSP
jgi:hypothetical protein